MPNPTACTSRWCSSSSVADSTIVSTSACSERPSTSRCTRSWTSSCSSTTPPSSLVPPRSMPMTLRLMRGGEVATSAIYGGRRGQGPAPAARIPPERAPPPRFAMPSDKPEYRVYRSRPGFLNRLLRPARRRALRAPRPGNRMTSSSSAAAPSSGRPTAGAAPAPPAPPGEVAAAAGLPASLRAAGEPWYRRISWKRVLVGVLLFIFFWTALSFALFMISAGQQNDKISDATRAALDDSGNMLTSAEQHPRARLRPPARRGARPRRHDHAHALRRRQGGAPVDPARHARGHPGRRARTRSTRPTRSAASR